jgi:oleate hydratase
MTTLAATQHIPFLGRLRAIETASHDVVFTVEYSVRSAQTAVYRLLGLKRKPPEVYKGEFDLQVLYKAVMALHGHYSKEPAFNLAQTLAL